MAHDFSLFKTKPKLLAIFISILPATVWSAEQKNIYYNIAPQSLEKALDKFSEANGIKFSIDSRLLKGRRSNGLHGNYTVNEGIDVLLSGTDLSKKPLLNNTWTVSNDNVMVVHSPHFMKDPISEELVQNTDDDLITKDSLKRISPTRPGDIFNGSTDTISSNSSNSTGIQVNLRGLQGNGRVNTMIDGSQQSSNTYRGYAGTRDNTYLDPDLIGGIDIKKGVDAGPYSGNAIGGAVNFRTINGDDIIKKGKTWGLMLKQSYGNNVSKGRITSGSSAGIGDQDISRNDSDIGKIPTKNQSTTIAASFRPTDNLEITLAHSNRESGNYKAGKQGIDHWTGNTGLSGKEVKNTSINSEDYLFKVRAKIDENQSISLSYNRYKNNYGFYTATSGLFTGVDWQYPLQTTTAQNYSANYVWNSDNPLINLRANIWGSNVNGAEDFESPITKNSKYGTEIWNTSNFKFLSEGLFAVKYGVNYSTERQKPEENATFTLDGKRESKGVFSNFELTPYDWIKLDYGLQRNITTMRDVGYADVAVSGVTSDMVGDEKYKTLNHSLGITLTPTDYLTLFATYSTGGRAPSLRERYMGGVVTPNKDLKPEDARDIDFGFKLKSDNVIFDNDHLDVKVSRFMDKYKNYIMRLYDWDLGEETNYISGQYKFSNISQADLSGYNVSLKYDTDYFFVDSSITYYDRTSYCYNTSTQNMAATGPDFFQNPVKCYSGPSVNDYGNYVPPRIMTSSSIGIKALDKKMIVGLRYRTTSRSLYSDPVSGLPWDNSKILDLFAEYKINEYLNVNLSVDNITNQFYYPAFTSLQDPLPAPGRVAKLILTANF